jgi:prepilin signal peptidase PulO-like enzyme (type II secretory pathway)
MNITLIIPLILGWLAGLFVNYASDVLPVTRRFSRPTCKDCSASYSWMDYLSLRACRACGERRSLRTWLVQIVTTAAFIYFWLYPPKTISITILWMIVLIYFGIILIIDLEHRLILHPTSLFGAILGLIVGTSIQTQIHGSLLTGLGYSLLGGLFGFAAMFVLYKFGELVARYRARKMAAAGQADDEEEALGGGDMFLAGVLGLMLGWPFIFQALLLGVLLGGLVSIIFLLALVVQRRYSSEALMTFIPYGPYFILSAFYFLFL